MSKQVTYGDELEKLKSYLKSELNEDAKRPLLYPLFQKLFKDKFRIESAANGADVYIEGALLVEAKTNATQWLEGFYQALHYQKKFGLAYNTIMVIAQEFVGIWRVNKIPETAVIFAHTADAQKAPNIIGKENAKKTQKALKTEIKDKAMYWLEAADLKGDIFAGAKNLTTETFEVLKILKNLDSDRLQINTHNFIHCIERMKPFFEQPIEAVHCFYSIVAFWDITATLAINDGQNEIRVIGFKGQRFSENIAIPAKSVTAFRKFIEGQYVFTNEGSGLTVDYYFSRFDEVLAMIDPEYVKQHGIFFTNDNLSKFALWFVKQQFGESINDNYIVFDPAGGSGNLISAWRGKLKHKIISELQPDLLKTIEKRMKADPFHLETGFTIIPKTSDNKGLNFLDRSAQEYWADLEKELKLKQVALDKPLAFLLNPPYKNTDENQSNRESKEAHYALHPSITALTGEDAAKERYLAFLGQILNIAKHQNTLQPENQCLVLIFTPTSWLIPRPTYKGFREIWDKHFEYQKGMIVTSNEWFKLEGKWPLAFTVWKYSPALNREKKGFLPPLPPLKGFLPPLPGSKLFPPLGGQGGIRLLDFTHLSPPDLNINWNDSEIGIETVLLPILNAAKTVILNNERGDIRETLPLIDRKGKMVQQTRVNLYRNVLKEEKGKAIISGFPLKDDRHTRIKDPYGFAMGTFVGFMDDNTPLRLKQEPSFRFSHKPDRVWFRLDTVFININQTKTFSGAADNRSYCAFDLATAKATFTWFCTTKVLNGKYPVWANQYDIWSPAISAEQEKEWYSLCFAFVLAENRCVVTKFEADNPVKGAPEIFVDNPLCPVHTDNFWGNVIEKDFLYLYFPSLKDLESTNVALQLIEAVKNLYRHWNKTYCKGDYLYYVGLEKEPYFRYFDYADFLTPHSGLIQIRKYSEQEGLADMLAHFSLVSAYTKQVKARLYEMLVGEMQYFG